MANICEAYDNPFVLNNEGNHPTYKEMITLRDVPILPMKKSFHCKEDEVLNTIQIYKCIFQDMNVTHIFQQRLDEREKEFQALQNNVEFPQSQTIPTYFDKELVLHETKPITEIYHINVFEDMGHITLCNKDGRNIRNSQLYRLIFENITTSIHDNGCVTYQAMEPVKNYTFGSIQFVVDFSNIYNKE